MNIQRALSIPGWMADAELAYLAEAASKSTMIAEIGSWKGRSTRALAENTEGLVFAIDTWKGSAEPEHIAELTGKPENWLYDTFLANMADLHNVCPHRETSQDAAERFARAGTRFDFIFIDASHDYENISADIRAWKPLLREGGILAGHDYQPAFTGIVQAVGELIPHFRVVEGLSLWTTEAA